MCLPLTMAGCGLNEAARPAIDLASLRCPPVRPADARALRQTPPVAPAGAVTDAKAKAWIDGLESQIDHMNKAGGHVLYQYGRCRSGAAG